MFSFRVLAGVVNCESDHSVDTGGSRAMVAVTWSVLGKKSVNNLQ